MNEFEHYAYPKANKSHECCECGITIPKGQHYERWSGVFDGAWSNYKTCWSCAWQRNELFKIWTDYEGIPFGELRDALDAYDREHLTREGDT